MADDPCLLVIIAADVLLWRNKKISSSVLAVATVVWVFFEWLDYHFLTIACVVLVLGMVVQFAWSTFAGMLNGYCWGKLLHFQSLKINTSKAKKGSEAGEPSFGGRGVKPKGAVIRSLDEPSEWGIKAPKLKDKIDEIPKDFTRLRESFEVLYLQDLFVASYASEEKPGRKSPPKVPSDRRSGALGRSSKSRRHPWASSAQGPSSSSYGASD
ncbi:hypothetical protein GUJ93_ZPchr0013g37111 [Zizania palustris]|uniref:Reticulon-like protein n=1 Tax=Zizania palustris TaxID=103762 RepID=A0A8J6BZ37_ZIZPA|nr:hypothetical protein GUJ93_ZPchr0013g37111 [Zizania palustris]